MRLVRGEDMRTQHEKELTMTQVNGKRDYKHAYKLQKASGETKDQIERLKARRKYDKEGIDRTGKHIRSEEHTSELQSH